MAHCRVLLCFNSDIVECKVRSRSNDKRWNISFNSDIVECKDI